jgi:2-polyprenyl-3-methyl-5-hydroxy-6-metoxy-1,4-benzoquinol methylase
VADELAFERAVKRKLVAKCDRTKMNLAIRERSSIVYEEIKSYFQGQTLLDVGCGNGFIGQLAKRHFREVQLLDIVNYLSPEVKLPFLLYREGQKLPVERAYDTVFLLTVLHHSNDPLALLKET